MVGMKKEIEAFETWYFNKHYAGTTACRLKVFEKFENLEGTEKPYNGKYINDRVVLAWETWQSAKSQAVHQCEWRISFDDTVFETSCGHTFELSNSDSLSDNNMKHCCFCGGKIEAQEQSHESN